MWCTQLTLAGSEGRWPKGRSFVGLFEPLRRRPGNQPIPFVLFDANKDGRMGDEDLSSDNNLVSSSCFAATESSTLRSSYHSSLEPDL